MNSRPGAAGAERAAALGCGRARRGGGLVGRRTGAAVGGGAVGAGADGAGAASSGRAAVSGRTKESAGAGTYPPPAPSVESRDPELKSHGAATAPSTTSVTTPAGSQRNLVGTQCHLEGGGG